MLPDPAPLLLVIAATAAIALVLITRRTFRYENCSVVMYSSRFARASVRFLKVIGKALAAAERQSVVRMLLEVTDW